MTIRFLAVLAVVARTGDIAVTALGVDGNDIAYNKVFPYEPTPQNGRSHDHHGSIN